MLKIYYQLAKPGIIYGNAITAIGGFFLASRGVVDWKLFLAMLLGISFVIGSGCVFNNYLDREIDQKMARTKKRALVSGEVSVAAALIYGTILGLLGGAILLLFTNLLTFLLGALGFFVYVVVYGIAKRRSAHGTLVGSVAGSIPIVVGYCAVSGTFDTGAILLFFILCLWQMPHFYAIAMYRLNDYQDAGIPVLPATCGMQVTKLAIISYTSSFVILSLFPTFYGYTGYTYLIVMLALGLAWLWVEAKNFTSATDPLWGRQVFRFSLVVILGLSLMISLGPLLP